MFSVTCPYCGRTFDYFGDKQTIFCVSCGKKLQVNVSVSGEDGAQGSVAVSRTEPANVRYTGSSGNFAGYFHTGSETRVEIRLPELPIPTKSPLVGFIVKWDGENLGQYGCGETVNVMTDAGLHSLEIVQKNDSLLTPLKYWKVFDVNTSATTSVCIRVEGKQFVI